MSKKFFTLINGSEIHIAPDARYIPAKEFSKLLDSKELIKNVKIDAETYRLQVTAECEKIKEQAYKEGFEEGFTKWAEKLAELETEVDKVQNNMAANIVPIAIKAAQKIVGKELKTSSAAVVDIIRSSLKSVAQHKKITIYVNRKEFETVEEHRDHIKSIFENLESLSIRPQDDIESGGCIIETESGIINAQLANQWLILEQAFTKLINKNPKQENVSKTNQGSVSQ